MLNTSKVFFGKEKDEIVKQLLIYQEYGAKIKDLENQIKELEKTFKPAKDYLLNNSSEGLNEADKYTWELHVSKEKETFAFAKLRDSKNSEHIALYNEIKEKANEFITTSRAKQIKNIGVITNKDLTKGN